MTKDHTGSSHLRKRWLLPANLLHWTLPYNHVIRQTPRWNQGALSTLAWIEYIAAEKKILYVLTRMARNLKRYFERRTKYVSPLEHEVQTIGLLPDQGTS